MLVYQLDSYRYWENELGRDDFVHGQFGENFTVDGLADDEVCIGDRYRIGDAAVRGHPAAGDVLPGGHPPGRAADGRAARRPRTARVLPARAHRRVVGAGDEIVKVASGPEAMTVAEIDALLLPARTPRPISSRAPCASQR